MTQTLQSTVIVSGKTLLRDYNAYKALGYTTLWSGDGKICLQAPKSATTAQDFGTWDTSALVRLARILKLTAAVQTVEERRELAQVMTELAKRDSQQLV